MGFVIGFFVVGFLELSADFIDFVRDEVVDRATEFDL